MVRGSGASGARRLAQSVRHGMDAETPPEMAAYGEYGEGGETGAGDDQTPGFMLEEFCRWDGNIAELFNDSEEGKRKLQEIGQLVLREYKLDDAARTDWRESAERALETAGQKKGEKKTYPFNGAADVRFPLLTTSSIQFAARAYPNIVRGDEVVQVKINGEDVDSAKADRSERVSAFCNDQIIYQCPEWENGTDQLLHQLPITGAGFRKVYWDATLRRPRFDYAPALKVIIPIDAPSIEMSPRVTHVLDSIYPYDYEARVASGQWLKCEVQSNTADSQKPILFLEQCRYIDLDEDGLSEPYIVTVHEATGAVVRIDPAFDEKDIKRAPPEVDPQTEQVIRQGKILAVTRLLPWVDYCFLPDPQGGAYGIGFGKLLEEISDTINTLLNQMIDAGHWSNTNTGFVGAGLKVRGGTISLEPNVFKMLDGVQNVQQAIQRLEFPGPSAVSFNLVDMLLGAAKDITAIKDVLAGDMPGGQHVAEGTVMALIEQGLQVFTSIYKRIYRSMRKEFELQCRLNQRYLDPADYQKFLDARPKPPPQMPEMPGAPPPGMGHNGGPPLAPEDMGAPMAGAPPMPMDGGAMPEIPLDQMQGGQPPAPMPGQGGAVLPFPVQPMQAALPPPDPQTDFDMSDLDVRPIADPSALTDMQRMAKAQFKLGFLNDPAANRIAILKSVFRDARIPNPEEYLVEKNPVMEKMAELETALKEATVAKTQAEAQLAQANAQKIGGDVQNAGEERALRTRELDQKDRELTQKDIELDQKRQGSALEAFRADMEDADREVRLVMEATRERREQDKQSQETAERQADRETQLVIAAHRATGKTSSRETSGAQQAELGRVLEAIQKMGADSQERIAASIGKMLDGMADSNSQIAAGLKAMAESIERSNKIALAPTELVKGSDGKPAGSRKRLD